MTIELAHDLASLEQRLREAARAFEAAAAIADQARFDLLQAHHAWQRAVVRQAQQDLRNDLVRLALRDHMADLFAAIDTRLVYIVGPLELAPPVAPDTRHRRCAQWQTRRGAPEHRTRRQVHMRCRRDHARNKRKAWISRMRRRARRMARECADA